MKQGFIVGTGTYAAVPFEDKLMIIYNGQQLDVVNTEQQARAYIQQHKKLNPKPRAPRKPRASQNSQKIEKPSSGQQESETPKPKATKSAPTKPKSKSVPVEKPSTRRKKSA